MATAVAAWPNVALGDLCAVVKGISPTMKTEPGPFPLVVTAAHRRTASTYQIEGPAVCVPLISSTGHGHASMHRVHYQEGRFALANLLVALQPKDPTRCDAKYLYHLLMAKKDEYFVPLMQGTANVSLKEQDVASVKVPLPPADEQRRIVARIEELAARIEEARGLKNYTLAESRRFWKVLSGIARDTHWPVRRLDEMAEFLDGRRIPLSEADRATRKGPYPYYGASGVIDYLDEYLFDEELLLLSEDGANLLSRSTPIAFVASGKYWVNNHAHVLRPLATIADLKFLAYALADYDVSVFNFASAQAKLNQSNARKIAFPLPPLEEQVRIVEYLDALNSKAGVLEQLQSVVAAELDALLPSVLDQAFRGKL